MFFETSAKTGDNIEEVFLAIGEPAPNFQNISRFIITPKTQ